MSGTQFDPVAVQAFLAEETTLREMVDAKCLLPPDQDIAIPQTQTTTKGARHDIQH